MRKATSLLSLAIAVAFSAILLNAQQTWNGFRFGMTLAEVKSRVHLTKDEDPGWYLGPSITIRALPFVSRFVFGPTLKQITLSYDNLNKDLSGAPPFAAVTGEIVEDLSGKYGKPVNVRGNCEADGQRSNDCWYTWSSHGQTIVLSSHGIDGRMQLLVVSYQRPQSEL